MTWRRALVWLLAVGAAVLSFDALRAFALGAPPLAGGVIPVRTVVDREWLAALWAVEIDAMAAAGILGARQDRRDWRAWTMFVAAAVASVGFQVFTLPAVLARAVPPVALFLAIVVLELPRDRPAWEPTPLGHPTPDQGPTSVAPDDPAHNQPRPNVVPTRPRVAHGSGRQPGPAALGRPADQGRDWSAQVGEATRRAAQGQSANRITKDLGLSDRARKGWVADLVREHRPTPAQVGHPNGDGP